MMEQKRKTNRLWAQGFQDCARYSLNGLETQKTSEEEKEKEEEAED
jgi:hypothetical protein